MLNFLQKNTALVMAILALTISGCQAVGLNPLPNPYKDTAGTAETTLVTIKSFGAIQETLIDTCELAEAGSDKGNTCVALIQVERTLRPAVTAAGQIGAEYADIDFRIKEAGADAPAEWLALAAETAGRLAVVYEPVREDVDEFIENAGELF